MRYTGPKHRLQKREGSYLFLKSTNKGDTGKKPGMHGKGFGKLSEFGKQLREKQKVKRIFGITERTCQKYFREAVRRKGVTGVNFLALLETRLDNVAYRAGFALTRAQARQMVGHRVFEVNGKRVDIPSFAVKPGDKVTVREKFSNHPVLLEMEGEKVFPPKWMRADLKKRTVEIERIPEADEMEQSVTLSMIVEFYSR